MPQRPTGTCGTIGKYRRGCRCDQCREAKKLAMRRYVAMVKERDGLTPTQKIRGVRPNIAKPCTVCGVTVNRSSLEEPMCTPCRKRSRRGIHISPAERRAIYASDDWTCQFCMEPVDRSAKWTDPWAPTLDHIVPRVVGGSDDVTNLRTLHRYCNGVRNSRTALTIDDLAG